MVSWLGIPKLPGAGPKCFDQAMLTALEPCLAEICT